MGTDSRTTGISEVLHAPARSAEIPENMAIYGWLVGSWQAEVYDYERDGSKHVNKGEWHFGWVLEGRAIQDVWIVPPRATRRNDNPPSKQNRYGTTIRVYDPGIDAWHITWINPVSGAHFTQVGRKRGDNIVQEGRSADGNLTRWMFSNITQKSFRWSGEVSTDGGDTWFLHSEFFLRRLEGSA